MRSLLVILLFANSLCCCSQQSDLNTKVSDLAYVEEMPYIPELSGDSLFWVVVKVKLEIVPHLIEKLTDTTITKASVPNFGGYYTVADIAYKAITEIIHEMPTLEFAEDPSNPEPREGYWEYWDYTRRSIENREKFKNRVKNWYLSNNDELEWIEYTREFRTSEDWKSKS